MRATWSSFFGRQKRRFARMTETFFADDNDCCNDNYDDNYIIMVILMMIMTKMTKKHAITVKFE